MKTVGIVGGAGYTAGELIRLLINHPKVSLDFVYSTSNAGNKIHQVHQDLIGDLEMKFTDSVNANVDVLFLCLGHGNSTKFLEKYNFAAHTKIIDLSNDFRLQDNKYFQDQQYIYGLPELNKKSIEEAQFIANPGCFATAIQLAILPLAFHKLLTHDVHINAVTGATGAGVSLSKTTHFTWRDNNFSHYKAFNHQHLGEIEESVKRLQPTYDEQINFIPNRGNFSRGIFATAYTECSKSVEDIKVLYTEYYQDAVFTKVSTTPIHLKQVVNTNKCILQIEKHGKNILITSVIDNLLKGASGQAIHNMNLMLGWPEDTGLQLKANFF